MMSERVTFPKPCEVTIEGTEVPEPSVGQVLIKTLVTLISTGTELTILSGNFPPNSTWARYGRYPFFPGYSNVGRIIEVGKGVNSAKVGDRVASSGPHAQYFIAEEKDLIPIPDGLSDEETSFHTLASGVMNAVRLGGVSLGEFVTVIGVGLLGQFAVAFSRLCGGFPVVAIDLSQKRLDLARLSGAIEILKADESDLEAKIASLSKGRMADVVFEVTGNPKVIPRALRLLKRQGRYVQLSSPRGPSEVDFHDEVNAPSRIIIGAHFSSQPAFETPYNPWTRRRNTELFFSLLTSGIMDIKHLITHRYPFREAPEAYRMLLEDRSQAMGVLLDFR
ncbi:MAG: zinc-binding dehydrogenase [Candidatus Bathyarchaeia archaeon]